MQENPKNIKSVIFTAATPDNDETRWHQRKDSLLLAEHNLLCEAFSIPSLLGIVEYARIIPCLLDPLNKIWTMVEWKDNYVSSVSQLFSDGQFLKMAYHVVKFGEEQLKMSKTEGSGARDLSTVVLLKLILPLLLQLLQCIHALWNEDANCLPEELERAKCLSGVELATILESTDGLYDIDNVEYLHRNKTGALLEGTRHRVYNVVGLCTSVEGVFSELLNSLSATDAFVNGLRSMELRHLGKVIRLVVVPLVKNCPCKFWKLWMVDFLGPILTECEYRLHFAWFDLLYHGGTGKPYFYGNLVGPDRQINALKQKLLLAFTRKCRIFLECYQLRNKMWSLSRLLS
ncbi:protein HASTY 1-like isoform X1 [Hordeum vulgare subsp. vulgare]|uniref:protein HASTY 1-like isoform X1 n=1 Tax=Hordeum vulgare subsp. vulgare TaxID=112509 RepID=UPI001D1A4F06|nr:protein HASTY 1-like isoform X1 [Hordeum vulgare subsp. vulgare]